MADEFDTTEYDEKGIAKKVDSRYDPENYGEDAREEKAQQDQFDKASSELEGAVKKAARRIKKRADEKLGIEGATDILLEEGKNVEGIGLPSAIFVGLIVFLIGDALAVIPIIGSFLDIGTSIFVFVWVRMIEGIDDSAFKKKFMLKNFGGPFLDVLVDFLGLTFVPIQTVTWIWIVIDSHSAIARKLTKLAEKTYDEAKDAISI